jgi:hypothetical protein
VARGAIMSKPPDGQGTAIEARGGVVSGMALRATSLGRSEQRRPTRSDSRAPTCLVHGHTSSIDSRPKEPLKGIEGPATPQPTFRSLDIVQDES